MFPKYFRHIDQRPYLLKQRLFARISQIRTGEDSGLMAIERQMMDFMKPKKYNWYDKGNEELKLDKSFNTLCASLSNHCNDTVKKMTMCEVYSLIEYVKENQN